MKSDDKNQSIQIPVSAASSLKHAIDELRKIGWAGPIKVCVRSNKGETMEYLQNADGVWHRYGNVPDLPPTPAMTLDTFDAHLRNPDFQEVLLEARKPAAYLSGKRSGRWNIRLIEVAEVAKLIGEDTFAAFQKCFVGADRLISLFKFYSVVVKPASVESPSIKRDFHVILVLLVGTIHELGYALRDLFSSKVMRKIRSGSINEQLIQFKRQWLDNPIAKRIRDQAGHHLGKVEAYKLGVSDHTTTAIDMDFLIADGQGLDSACAIGAWDLLFRGLSSATEKHPEITVEQLNTFIRDSFDLPNKFHKVLADAFVEVLRNSGVQIITATTD